MCIPFFDQDDYTNDNDSAFLKIDGKSVVTEINSQHAGDIMYDLECNNEFQSTELKIERFANYLQN